MSLAQNNSHPRVAHFREAYSEPFRGKNTSFFQSFVRVKWHNPETLTHVGKYRSVGNLHKVRSMVLSAGQTPRLSAAVALGFQVC